jgi:prepilin-type N-terminal cleavage/methylation domain-containing protein
MKRFCKTSRNPKGFTLVEVLVVIAVVAILSTVVTISISAVIKSSQKKAAASSLESYWRITSIYMNQCNLGYGSFSKNQLKTRFPANVLKTLSTEPCVKGSLTKDGTIYIQYKENPKSTVAKYSIVRITLRSGGKLYSTTNGTKLIGPSAA